MRKLQRQPQTAIAHVEVQPFGMLLLDAFGPAPDLRGQCLGQVLRQAERFTDVANGPFGAIPDDRRTKRGAVASIGLVDPLDDFLAPFVFKVDVDVGRFSAFFRNKAFEQQVIAVDSCLKLGLTQ